jgi:hypothetical protein
VLDALSDPTLTGLAWTSVRWCDTTKRRI